MSPSTRRRLVAPLAIFAVALAARLVALRDARNTGFFTNPISDGQVYIERARGVAAGDWLGPPDFVHAPSYAYFLGLLQIVASENLWVPRIVQALGGAAACVLLLLACRRLFDTPTAHVAGFLLAIYPPAIFFDGLIQKASLTLLLSTLLLWLAIRSSDQPSWWSWGIVGAILGLLILTRQNALAFVPLLLAWIWLAPRTASRRQRLAWLGAAIAGLLIALLPWTMRNRAVIGEWVLTTPNLGQNFAMGNHPDATGTYLPFQRGRASAESEQQAWTESASEALGRPLSPREVSDYYLNAALQWIWTHPAAALRLTLRKCLFVWGAYEFPDAQDYYLYRERSPLLRGLDTILHFGVLAPVAAAGLVITFRHWRRLWLLYAWLLITTLATAFFVVFARYRLPLVPVLAIFAAVGIVTAGRLLLQRTPRKLLAPALALIAVALASNWPLSSPRQPRSFSYRHHAVALADQQRYEEAIAELRKALALAPEDVDTHITLGSVCLDLGQHTQALHHFEQARAGDPTHARTYRGLGDALIGLDRLDEAVQQYDRAAQLDPDDPITLNCLASAQARRGRFAQALELFERTLALAPDYADAHLNLGNTYLSAGQLDSAAAAYEHALRCQPEHADALHNLGVVEMQRGNTNGAIDCFRRILKVAPHRPGAQTDLVHALLAAQRTDEALDIIRKTLATDPAREDMQQLRQLIEQSHPQP